MAEGTFGAFLPGVDAAVRRALTELHRLIRSVDDKKLNRAGDTMTGQLFFDVSTDLSPTGGGTLIVGKLTGGNVALDDNEIMARNNGATSDLHLNADGGSVRVGNNSLDASLFVNGKSVATIQSGTYTPTLTNITLGTGGTASGSYIWIGGTNVGDVGQLTLAGQILLGTAGIAVSGSARFSLPSDFQMTGLSNIQTMNGAASFYDNDGATKQYTGGLRLWTPGVLAFTRWNSSSQWADISSTTPFTWAVNDDLYWCVTVPAVRV